MSQTKDTTELTDDSVVWRFMDLWKFLYMLEKRALYLTRIDKLEDPYDGQLHPDQHDLAKQRIMDALERPPRSGAGMPCEGGS